MRLEIERLACRRGGRTVFREVNFAIGDGDAALLRGPNGVGKSTLLRVLAGMIPAAAGAIRIDGKDLVRDAGALQERVAYAGHLDAIKPALTVRQNVSVWAGIFGTGEARVDPALDFFGLAHIPDRPAAQCSAGQKRRLGLARLMVVDRPLWLLDEPTVSLDTESAGLVADLVKGHCAGGGSAMIATHIDLALDPGPVLNMVPPDEAPVPADGGVSADSFLEGNW